MVTPPSCYKVCLLCSLLWCPVSAFYPYASTSRLQRTIIKSTENSSKEVDGSIKALIRCFHGTFDNYEQVAKERKDGLLPGESGGHEHISVRIQEVDRLERFLKAKVVLAAKYYFDGDEDIVFRFRLYGLTEEGKNHGFPIRMKIYRFTPPCEQLMRERKYDLSALLSLPWGKREEVVEYLEGCDITWNTLANVGEGFKGYMEEGGCRIESQNKKGVFINVEDDLVLSRNVLYINDRGIDDCGRIVYGNHRGVPYHMKRQVEPAS